MKNNEKLVRVAFNAGEALDTMSDDEYGKVMRRFLHMANNSKYRNMDFCLDRLFDCILEIDRILRGVEK